MFSLAGVRLVVAVFHGETRPSLETLSVMVKWSVKLEWSGKGPRSSAPTRRVKYFDKNVADRRHKTKEPAGRWWSHRPGGELTKEWHQGIVR